MSLEGRHVTDGLAAAHRTPSAIDAHVGWPPASVMEYVEQAETGLTTHTCGSIVVV